MPQISRRRVLARSTAAGLTLVAHPFARAQEAEPPTSHDVVQYTDPVTYDIEHRVTFTNGTARLRSVEVWLPVPVAWNGQQVRDVRIDPDTARIQPDTTGTVNVARLHRTRGLPGNNQSFDVVANYQVTTFEARTDHEAASQESFDDYDADEIHRRFTRAETKIETRDRAVRRQAAALREAYSRPYDLALAAYEWVIDRTRYQSVDGLKGASFCLTEQYGECGDYTALFVALCRAAGVPARPVVGFWADEQDGWHVWAEFMCPCGAWIPVDGSLGDQSAWSRQYYFGSLDNRRVALAKTYDVRLRRSRVKIEALQMGASFWSASVIGTAPQTEFTVHGKPGSG